MVANLEGRPIHLVGSVPLASAKDVFTAVGKILNGLVPRMPDGETGVRKDWILFQGEKLRTGTNVIVVGQRDLPGGTKRPILNLAEGAKESDVEFGPLGYAEAAKQSYSDFLDLREKGIVGRETRFQVCLPTPLAPIQGFFEKPAVRTAWTAYELRMLAEISEITRAIPHGDLSIQFDVCYEFIFNLEPEKSFHQFSSDELLDAVARVSEAVPEPAELGFHLCYGDLGHKHVVEPADTALLTDVANQLTARIKRPINWVHFPIPRGRDDDAYFAPLRGLELAPQTELYAGLVHFTDGLPGAERRLAAVRKFLPKFGIATECGFGRRPPETIEKLLELHRDVAMLS
jgi:hypothetical protein